MHSEFSFLIVYFDILDSDFNLNHFSQCKRILMECFLKPLSKED